MEAKDIIWIQTQTGLDILGIVMDFQSGRKSASETMEDIAKYTEISFNVGKQAGIQEIVDYIKNRDVNEFTPHYTWWIDKKKWDSKLKEWGIK